MFARMGFSFNEPLHWPKIYYLQVGPSGRGTLFIYIKVKVPHKFELIRHKQNSYFYVNQRL